MELEPGGTGKSPMKLGHETRLNVCAENYSTAADPDHPQIPQRFLLDPGLIKPTLEKASLIRRELGRGGGWVAETRPAV